MKTQKRQMLLFLLGFVCAFSACAYNDSLHPASTQQITSIMMTHTISSTPSRSTPEHPSIPTWTSIPSYDPALLPTIFPMPVQKQLAISEFDRPNAILFSTSRGHQQWIDVAVINSDGSNRESVTFEDSTHYDETTDYNIRFLSPAWSPDGAMYAYVSQAFPWDGIRIRRENLPDSIIASGAYSMYSDLSWSPDGRFIAFSTDTGYVNNDVCYVEVNMTNAGNAKNNCIHPEKANVYPSWSKDGKSIIFSGGSQLLIYKGKPTDLFLWTIDTGNVTQITDTPESEILPKWSPDGARLAFIARDNDSLIYTLYIANSDGSERIPVAGTGDVKGYDWSPDGKQIVYSEVSPILNSQCEGGGCTEFTTLKIIDIGTGSIRTLTDGKDWIGDPSWRP